MTDRRFFLDSNILMYAFGANHPLQAPCKKLLDLIGEGEIQVVTNTEVLQEILYRFFSIHREDLAYQLYDSMVVLCWAVFPVSLADTNRAKELLSKNKDIDVRDAIHIACMLNNNIETIISADHHFDKVKEIERIDPLDFPFD